MTQGETQNKVYNDEYIERAFTIWFSLNQPSNMDILREALPETPEGEKPGKAMLRQMRDNYGWIERADGINALAVQKNDALLVNDKAGLLRRQAEDAALIREKAKQQILDSGFDTSASAVSAYFKASEEERVVRGVADMMIKVSKMTPEELEAKAIKLLRRQNEAIEGEVVEDEVANSSSETTNG